MKMRYDLHLQQSQKLVITPQLQQAIQILQFTSLELEKFIEQELEKNPVLEVEQESDKNYSDEDNEDKHKSIDWKEFVHNENNNYTSSGGTNNYEDNEFNIESITSKETTLQEHLLFQYHLTLLDYKYREIGEYIINSLDENGYLTLTVEEISKDLKVEPSIVENILLLIQTFDPPGVAARDLKECLLLQLLYLEITDKNVYTVIDKYLEEIAAKKYPYIAKKLGIKVSEVQDICDLIKTLEPKPGRMFSAINNNYVVPDVVVRKVGEELTVQVNDSKVPRLIIRDDYKGLILNNNENEEAAKFLSDRFNSAVWLIKSIEQRRQTIHKVVVTIVNKQRAFFEKGNKYLKPMTLKEVADEIEVHESTVSRATNGKYVETPMGIFELKYFFSSGVDGFSSGEEFASESIKNYIKEIIGMEDTLKPMSDEKIAKNLAHKGINISRRTVAKYRDDLNIPPSSRRRRY